MAIAFFITFSTYGTWLHGADKGLGSVDLEHNQHGAAFVEADAARETAIAALSREKQWRLWAAHVRSNHVHVVIWADRDPGRLMSDLKARASGDLTRAGFDDAQRKRWTRHGSTLHLFDAAQLAQKIHYTLHEQGPPMAIFDGR